jgi:hypothetical protein
VGTKAPVPNPNWGSNMFVGVRQGVGRNVEHLFEIHSMVNEEIHAVESAQPGILEVGDYGVGQPPPCLVEVGVGA